MYVYDLSQPVIIPTYYPLHPENTPKLPIRFIPPIVTFLTSTCTEPSQDNRRWSAWGRQYGNMINEGKFPESECPTFTAPRERR